MLFNLEYIQYISNVAVISEWLYNYSDISGSLTKTENEKVKFYSAKIRYSYAIQVFNEANILNVCMKNICTAMDVRSLLAQPMIFVKKIIRA